MTHYGIIELEKFKQKRIARIGYYVKYHENNQVAYSLPGIAIAFADGDTASFIFAKYFPKDIDQASMPLFSISEKEITEPLFIKKPTLKERLHFLLFGN